MRLVILCPGQAAQRAGMLDDMLAAPDLGALREVASEVLGEDIADWWRRLDERALFLNANAQFAIAFYQIAVWARIAGSVPTPVAVGGYSLGEVLAWHVAGAMDARATLDLVRQRAARMDAYAPSQDGRPCLLLWRGRLSSATRHTRDALLAKHHLQLAIQRPGGDAVFGGTASDVAALLDEVVEWGAVRSEVAPLNVSIPAHTELLGEVVPLFRQATAASICRDPSIPVLAGIDGRLCRSRHDAPDVLAQQLASPIRWDWCQETLVSTGCDVVLELGPGSDLSRMLSAATGSPACRSVEEFASTDSLREWLHRQASRDH